MRKEGKAGSRAARVALAGTLALGALVAFAKEAKPDGKALFKEYCKPCHGEGAKAGEFTPMTLIGDQWERFFRDKFEATHAAALDADHGGKPVAQTLTPEMLQTVQEWLVDHAADSEHPMTCG